MSTAGRALVLGGGGVSGVAWETGLLHGLAELGIDLRTADLVVGTSAGSIVGAQIGGGSELSTLYQRQLDGYVSDEPVKLGASTISQFVGAGLMSKNLTDYGQRMGRAALKAKTVPEAERRRVIEERVGHDNWPKFRLQITAVDAETGELIVFDSDSGVELVDAVSASCAVPMVWPPVTIGGRKYVDGGMRSTTNVDVVAGCNRVVVIAPMAKGIRRDSWASTQLASLGPDIRSVLVEPDAAARSRMGRNSLDPAFRRASAEAGFAQAPSVAEVVGSVWNAPF